MIVSLQNSIQFTKQHLNALIGVEVVYFGTVLMGMLIAFFYPNLQDYYTDATEKELQSYYFGRMVFNAYDNGEFWKAATLTFLINFFVGTYVHIIIPSLIIPFAGLALAFYRALLWGILFAPIKPNALHDGWPHLITLIIEGEGYIFAALIVYMHGKQAKMISRQGYKAWFRKGYEYNCEIYPLIVLILLIAALYEAYEVIYLLSPDAKKFGH